MEALVRVTLPHEGDKVVLSCRSRTDGTCYLATKDLGVLATGRVDDMPAFRMAAEEAVSKHFPECSASARAAGRPMTSDASWP